MNPYKIYNHEFYLELLRFTSNWLIVSSPISFMRIFSLNSGMRKIGNENKIYFFFGNWNTKWQAFVRIISKFRWESSCVFNKHWSVCEPYFQLFKLEFLIIVCFVRENRKSTNPLWEALILHIEYILESIQPMYLHLHLFTSRIQHQFH